MTESILVRMRTTELATVLNLALGNPTRTLDQQAELLGLCLAVDERMPTLLPRHPEGTWVWRARRSWDATRCDCGRAIPVSASACGPCRSLAPVLDPGCTRALDAEGHRTPHRCTNRDGDPLRTGQACWPSARAQATGGAS